MKFLKLAAVLLFSCHSMHGMQSLKRKQDQIAEETMQPCTLKQIFLSGKDKQKDGITCGPRSIYLAAAVEKAFLAKKAINKNNISNALDALEFQPKMTECLRLGQLESDQFQAYVDFIRTKYATPLPYLFSINNDPSFGLYIGMPSSKTDDATVVLEKLKNEAINNTLSSPIHFICNIGGHWVAFSVTQLKGASTLWYIDPMNSKIDESIKSVFGTYICKTLCLNLTENASKTL